MENNNTRGTDSQHSTCSTVLSSDRIGQLLRESNGNSSENEAIFPYEFARTIEAEVARRFRAQGGSTNTDRSDLAPTTSTVSASEVAQLRSLLADAWTYVKDGGGDTDAIDKALASSEGITSTAAQAVTDQAKDKP